MNETVGMMTSEESFLNNYGAALQGYALQRTIDKFGYESRIIRYNGYGPKRRFGFIKDLIKKFFVSKEALSPQNRRKERSNLRQSGTDTRVILIKEILSSILTTNWGM